MFDATPSETLSEQATGLAELTMLESWLEHELRCESTHPPDSDGNNDSGCTVVATHRIIGCERATILCRSRAEYKVREMANGTLCSGCKRPASRCWRVTPI